ncbi:MAG: hypothetical protein JKY60_20535 [Kordiimonadaceae bacterium]|nr:hypothetical protein [Kordiimonadaceae bacterium]
MAVISVSSNANAVISRLSRFERQQVPFALAGAINDTAFDIRQALVDEWNLTFPKSRNKGFARAAFRVSKARKTNLTGFVFDTIGTGIVLRHAEGGTKRPRGGSQVLAIPQYGRGKLTRTRWGPRQDQQAAKLINGDGDYFSGRPKGHPGAPVGIYKRLYGTSRKAQGLRLVYRYKKEVFVAQDFDAYEIAQSVIASRFPIHFKRALARAISTAK